MEREAVLDQRGNTMEVAANQLPASLRAKLTCRTCGATWTWLIPDNGQRPERTLQDALRNRLFCLSGRFSHYCEPDSRACTDVEWLDAEEPKD